MNTELARYNMVEQQVRPWDVLDPRILDLFTEIPREDFVPPAYRRLAFADIRIPLGHGQAMMEPRLEARLLQSLDVLPLHRVLEIGTGSGYLTACLSRLCQSVTSVEIDEELSRQAGHRLAAADRENISLRIEDAMASDWHTDERYDRIAVTGSVPVVDRRFHDCLNIGGRLFMIVGESPLMEALLITRLSETEWATESLFETDVAPLIHAAPVAGFHF